MWLWDIRLYLLVITIPCLLLTNGDDLTRGQLHARHHHHHHQRHRQRVPFHRRICERYPRHTTAQRTPGDNGFRVRVLGVPSPDGYIPGEVYTVVINGTYPGQHFRGFMLVAVPQGAKSENVTIGTFKTFDDDIAKEAEDCSHTVMVHQTLSKEKEEVSLMWVAPSAGGGCVELRATVIEHPHIWYRDDGALTKVFCEAGQGDAAVHDPAPECCACGYASYKLTFENNWSHHNHPKDFPPKIFEPLLHWSNIVGASHNDNYRIWAYGQYASPGVKQVCEFGYPNTVEKELREHTTDIRTVVKTTSIFNLRETREARFTVDKKHHLFSFLSMLGPSPDWCVGLSGFDMCLPNCSWAHDQVIELFPWDAGTDSGVTYMSKNVMSQPPEKIHRITNTFPAHPEAPFYNPGLQMKPVARLYLKRLYPRTDSMECEEDKEGQPDEDDDSPTDEELIAIMKKKMMMQKKIQMEKCATSEWADWTECTVTCGVGFKYRKRMFLNPLVTEDMCNLSLEETDNCIGVENTCGDDLSSIYSYRQKGRGRRPNRKKNKKKFEVRYDEAPDPNDPCAMTPWSDWSPCSVSCGKGMHERFRMFLHKTGTGHCTQSRMEKEVCMASIVDCHKATMMKNFTAVCSLRADRGLCRGNFPRWYYNTNMRKCLPFDYTGCRGNDNNFETMEQCHQMCHTHMATLNIPSNDEVQGSEEEALKLAMMKKQKMLQQQQENAEDESLKQLMMKKKMMEQQGAGGEVGDDDLKLLMMKQQLMEQQQNADSEHLKLLMMKKQMMERQQEEGGVQDGGEDENLKLLMMKKQRMLQQQQQREREARAQREREEWERRRRGPRVDCMVTPWTDWTPCSVSCGKGITTKLRMIKAQPQNGGKKCPRRLMKKKKCRRRKCAIDCRMSNWSGWSRCSKTCGSDVIQERRRRVQKRPKHGGRPCDATLERRYCSLPDCPGQKGQRSSKVQYYYPMHQSGL